MKGIVTLHELPHEWQAEAARLRGRYGLEEMAKLCEALAGELSEALRDRAEEELTLDQAVAESGYSKRRLRQLVAEGSVPNAGRKGAPRIRRADLPRKARKTGTNGFDAAAHARDILGGAR